MHSFIELITNPIFVRYFFSALLVAAVGWVLVFIVAQAGLIDLARNWLEDAQARVRRYEANELKQRMGASTRKY